jgi:isopenicillin-N epimerase
MTAFGKAMLEHWPLEEETLYLNHGTVGVAPKRVLAVQQAIRDEIERQPSRFMLRELADIGMGRRRPGPPRLRVAADAVARFLGARGDDLVFVDNATSGANAVLRSFPFEPGDEILRFDHAYGGVARAADYAARRAGAVVRVVALPDPPRPDAIVAAIEAAIGPRTSLAVIDHITSETAIVLPLAAIAAVCRARGVRVLADGAHAPGQVPLDVPSLGVDWYVANLHKWAWTPRSCGVLWAARERQTGLHPTVISHGLDEGLTNEFDWVGTRDPSAALSAPAAIAYMEELGIEAIQAYDHALAWRAGQILCERFGTSHGRSEDQIGSMIALPLPETLGTTAGDADRVRDGLLYDDHIEVALHARYGRLWIRVCAQIYNDLEDVERLADALEARMQAGAKTRVPLDG